MIQGWSEKQDCSKLKDFKHRELQYWSKLDFKIITCASGKQFAKKKTPRDIEEEEAAEEENSCWDLMMRGEWSELFRLMRSPTAYDPQGKGWLAVGQSIFF